MISRPIDGETPYIDLVLGYRKNDPSPLLASFIAHIRERVAQGGESDTDRAAPA